MFDRKNAFMLKFVGMLWSILKIIELAIIAIAKTRAFFMTKNLGRLHERTGSFTRFFGG